jgi:hypothetical protein
VNRHLHVNPYIAGSPVTGTEMFFGRDDVFSFIRRNLIGRHRDTPVVLYGQRRTGKTSVLYQLHRHLDPGYRCIFIDLHGLSLDGMGSLLHGIASSISRSLRREHQLTVPVPGRSLFLADPQSTFEARFLDVALSALGDDHLVLMLDEVVRLYEEVEHGRLEREIFEFLRHLMQHHERLNFIFSLGSGLEEMAKEYAFLFSVSLYHRISFLESAAARSLITEPARDHYRVTPQAVTQILQITSGHPYYIQLVCHCLFDSWSRAPRSVMDIPDVEAILAEAIELGSANLTYVWEDSTPEEQALMAGIAAVGLPGPGPVTIEQVRETWHKAGVLLPERELTRAVRSLISRDVLAGDHAYSFSVALQRLWLEKHRRMDWVKDELADSIQHWNRSAEPWPADMIPAKATGPASGTTIGLREPRQAPIRAGPRIKRRALGIAAVAMVLAGYLAVAAATRVFPFSPSPAVGLPQGLMRLLPAHLENNQQDCHNATPPGQWTMPGAIQTVRCTDSSLAGGNVYAFQLDSPADFQTAWQNFNQWWGFLPASAGKKCPPAGTSQGIVASGSTLLPLANRQLTECAMMPSAGSRAPAFAWSFPTNDAFVIAAGEPGSSFSALASWLISPPAPVSPTLAAGVTPLVQLLPVDINNPTTQCHSVKKPYSWGMPGLVSALSCTDPNLPNGYVDAYQMDTRTDYETAWRNFNTWWGFDANTAAPGCPPSGSSGQGTENLTSPDLPPTLGQGQVLECKMGTGNAPVYVWTMPTQNTFIYAAGAGGSSFSALDTWWVNNSEPLLAPPSPPAS